MTTVTRTVHFEIQGRRKRAVSGPGPGAGGPRGQACPGGGDATGAAVGRVPRVARLMALAIRFDRLLRDGVVANQSELARLTRVTQPRMTQIMNLLHLSPCIQEEILFLPEVAEGRDPVTERALRSIVQDISWQSQLNQWRAISS